MNTIKLDRNAFLAWFEGHSEEAKLEISQTIMAEFAKKYLKPLENDSLIKETINKAIKKHETLIESTLQKEIQDAIGTIKK